MSELLLYYRRPEPMTWVYMSSFLTIGLYFVFHRFWSIRNLDILLLILLAPGLLMVHEGNRRELREQRDFLALVSQGSPGAPESQPAGQDDAQADPGADPQSSGTRPGTSPPEAPPSSSQETSEEVQQSSGPGVAPRLSATVLQRSGFIWLFVIEACILIRLLVDPLMVRRPLLDPNLTTGGLNFIGISLFIFMMANVVTSSPRIQQEQGPALGPGYALMNLLPAIPTRPISNDIGGDAPESIAELTPRQQRVATIARVLAIVAHTSILVAIVLIGKRHFNNLCAGTGCALLYLLLPYTAQMTGRVDHAVPSALLLWGVLMYRRPAVAGVFIGLAAGLVYYPLFLLPLWFSFYWQRGVRRFGFSVLAMLVLLMLTLTLVGGDPLINQLRQMFGISLPTDSPRGIWELGWPPVYRYPVIVGFVILTAFFAAWPAQKNLGTLISCSAAVMVGAQFWHGYGGGMYIGWFLPLLLLTIFRPNLQDRIALKVIRPSSHPSRAITPRVDAA